MKKFLFSILMSVILCICLSACGTKNGSDSQSASQQPDKSSDSSLAQAISDSDKTSPTEAPTPQTVNISFKKSGISVNYGGNEIQTLPVDLTAALDNKVETLYQTTDCNFDGVDDLLVPVNFGATNTEYYIYLWDTDKSLFSETPASVLNPVIDAIDARITSYGHNSAFESVYSTYKWNKNNLVQVIMNDVNYSTLTIVSNEYDKSGKFINTYTTVFGSQEKLEANDLYSIIKPNQIY